MAYNVPLIQSVGDLQPLCEHFEPGQDGSLKFLHCSFFFVTKDYAVYFGRSSTKKHDLTVDEINRCLKRVSDEEIYPMASPDLTRSVDTQCNHFVKGPTLAGYDALEGTSIVANLLQQEANILEMLERNRHPNLERYHGCIVARGRIVGLVIARYTSTLEQRMRNDAKTFNIRLCFAEIESAVRHLHSLRLAHNDLNPRNIMLDAHGTTVLIDFGSCQPFGRTLTTAGTPGWDDGTFTTSEKRNDESALGKIWTWLVQQQEGILS